MAAGRIKGNAFREFLVWYAEHSGTEALRAAFDALPERLQSEVDPRRPGLGVLPSVWYPIELVHALLDTACAGLSDEELDDFARQAARATISRMMKGLQRAVFSLLVSPRRYPKVINSLWGLSYDTGRVQVIELSSTSHEGVITEWLGHHPMICRMNHLSKLHIYAAMGCRDVSVELTRCVSRGDPDCRSVVRWA
ncbi:MAG: hypothetical protein IPI67_02920 [Myxococcales bacterium]|nr:hypothetical protein [Myxococcales bacterium]